MKRWMGLDIGNTAVKAALFDPASGAWSGLHGEAREADPESSIAFIPRLSGGVRTAEPIFPIGPQFESAHPDAPVFRDLNRTLLKLRSEEEIEALATPVLQYFRGRLDAAEAELSLAVPMDYPASLGQSLCLAAEQAGFQCATVVPELTAAVLACLPGWHRDQAQWEALAAGRHFWVIDGGPAYLNLALVYVLRSGDTLSINHLAGDRIPMHGPAAARTTGDRSSSSPQALLLPALDRMRQHAGVPLDSAAAILCGDGPSAARALAVLTGSGRGIANAADHLAPAQIPASGAAVFAAMTSGDFPVRLGPVQSRTMLGIQVGADPEAGFLPFPNAGKNPPYDFEGAYRFQPAGNPLEITLAAALPGGQRGSALLTFVLQEKDLSTGAQPVGILIRGRVDERMSGRIRLHELHSGALLKEGNFRLW